MLSKALRFNRPMQATLLRAQPKMYMQQVRQFSDVAATEQEAPKEETSLEAHNENVGADVGFSKDKHGYVLSFPWNFEEIIQDFEGKTMSQSSYWHKWMVNTRTIVDFNDLFREFHQACAIPDVQGLHKVCEPKLASYVAQSIDRIHFHGLDIEMANLTIEQPSIRVIKAEVHQGLSVDRSANKQSIEEYDVTSNHNMFGAPWKTYAPKSGADDRHVLDMLNFETHRPYLVQVTCLIESPMKLFVQNQNYTHILFGNDDEESVKNVVKFEANLRWFDFMNLLPVENKKSLGVWKITDYNNILNENPLFVDE